MTAYVFFQDGSTFGQEDLARYSKLFVGDTGGAHLLGSAGNFSINSDVNARTVTLAGGRAYVYNGTTGYDVVEVTGDTVLDVPQASNLNPRRDLVVLTVGATGAEIKLVAGVPAVTPQAPARPARAVALAWVDVPKASTTFTATPTRYTGQYRDQMLMSAPGEYAFDWAGQLPDADGFRTGAMVYDLGTNQRWVKRLNSTWYTTDPGPWRSCTFQTYEGLSNVLTTPSGNLYVRESSTCWEIAGQVNLSPSNGNPNGLRTIGALPAGITRPLLNSYVVVGQTYSASYGGFSRLGLMASGTIEWGSMPTMAVGNIYVSGVIPKTPINAT